MADNFKQDSKDASEENLASAIRKISEGFDKLKKTGLNRKAIIVLLQDHTKVPKKQITKVLDGLGDLSKKYAS